MRRASSASVFPNAWSREPSRHWPAASCGGSIAGSRGGARVFGVFVVFYLFLGGTGAGAVVTCSLADLVLVRQPFGTSAYVQGPSVRPEARIVDFRCV